MSLVIGNKTDVVDTNNVKTNGNEMDVADTNNVELVIKEKKMGVADTNNVELEIKEKMEDKIADENNDELAIKEKKSTRAKRRRRNRSKTTTQQIVTEEIKRMSCLRSIGCNGFLFLFSVFINYLMFDSIRTLPLF